MPNMNNNSDQELIVIDGVSMRPFGLTPSIVYATDSTTTTTTGNTNETTTVINDPVSVWTNIQLDSWSEIARRYYDQLERDLHHFFSLESTEKKAKKKPKLTYAKFEWK